MTLDAGRRALLRGLDIDSMLAAFDVSPALIIITVGPDHTLAYQNPASASMIGPRPLGRPSEEAFADLPEWMGPLGEAYRTGRSLTYSDSLLGRTEGAVRMDASYTPLRDAAGHVVGVYAQGVDVTGSELATNEFRRASLLERASLELSGSLDPGQLAQVVTDTTSRLFGGWAVLDLWEPNGDLRRVSAGHVDPALRPLVERLTAYPSVTGRVRGGPSTSAMVAADGVSRWGRYDWRRLAELVDDEEHARIIRRLRTDAYLVVAVNAGAVRLGSLGILRPVGAPEFTAAERVVAEEFAARAGTALGHARAFDEQRRAILTLQHTTLQAAPPDVPGLEVAVRYRAAGRGVAIGGDWYDVFALDQGAVGVVIGDVEGHDLAAAGVMGQVRSVVHSQATAGLPPSLVCHHANRFVHELADARLVSMLYLQVHPDEHLCVLARAGHLPALVATGAGVEAWEGRGGLPFGVCDGGVWREQTYTFATGPIAVFTDGLVDTPDRTVEEGLQRLSGLLAAGAGRPLEEVADEIMEALGPVDGGSDDAALVLLSVPAVAWEELPRHVARSFPPTAASASLARSFLLDLLPHWGVADAVVDTVSALVTELMANATRHSDGPVEVRASVGTCLRLEVFDDSHRMPVVRSPRDDEPSGRGLQMIGILADRWGVTAEEGGKAVWLELDL